jgi:formamidopyrimidine-DNA glycosylase
MPELPEVETVCSGLKPFLENKTLKQVRLNRSNLRYPFPPFFSERLENVNVQTIERRAKYILIHLCNDLTWVIHLGMSGRIRINEPSVHKHDHVVWQTQCNHDFVYNDPRRFGFMDLIITKQLQQHPFFAHLGCEPFDDRLTANVLFERMAAVQRPLKSVLLDQSIIVGLGNIYVCEALWMSKLSPYRQANTVSITDWAVLLTNIRLVLTNAIAAGGSTLKDYAKPDGELGYFQHQFNVYGREYQLCLNAECQGVIERVVQAGRSTFYCPGCSVL